MVVALTKTSSPSNNSNIKTNGLEDSSSSIEKSSSLSAKKSVSKLAKEQSIYLSDKFDSPQQQQKSQSEIERLSNSLPTATLQKLHLRDALPERGIRRSYSEQERKDISRQIRRNHSAQHGQHIKKVRRIGATPSSEVDGIMKPTKSRRHVTGTMAIPSFLKAKPQQQQQQTPKKDKAQDFSRTAPKKSKSASSSERAANIKRLF